MCLMQCRATLTVQVKYIRGKVCNTIINKQIGINILKMSINLHINKELFANEELKLQFMPAKIKDDLNKIDVDSYFNTYTEETQKNLTNALRGYPLRGVNFEVPKGYRGVVFNENKKPLNEDAERNLKASGHFSAFTYWNYDKTPSQNDALAKVIDWMDISEALHESLSETPDESDSPNVKKEVISENDEDPSKTEIKSECNGTTIKKELNQSA